MEITWKTKTNQKIIWKEEGIHGIFILKEQDFKNVLPSVPMQGLEVVKELEEFHQNTVYERVYQEIRRKDLELKNPKKRMLDSFKIVDLSPDIIDRSYLQLSSSERKKLSLSLALLSNPSILMIEEPFRNLDKKNERRLLLLFQKMQEEYDKTIILISKDPNILYQSTKNILLFHNQKVIRQGSTKEILEDIEFLEKEDYPSPEIVQFTNLVKTKKKVKIDYHKDVRDIMKDIYKHV